MKYKFALKHFPNVSLGVTFKLLSENRNISLKYLPKAIESIIFNLLLLPSNIYETFKYKSIIESTKITKDPIFILGYWRSGTTNLQNLLVKDTQFGFASQFSTTYPQSFIVNSWMKGPVSHFIPKTRPMDNIPISLDLPQEEEFALCTMLPYSFYHSLIYPQKATIYFDKYGTLEDVDDKVREEWKSYYKFFLKKVTFVNNGKQLVLKNPVNTLRIKLLLKMFPNAKFIHIHRNPYEVFMSNRFLFNHLSQWPRLQDIPDQQEMDRNVIDRYKKTMNRYFNDYKTIPSGNLIEVRHEDLTASPLETLEKIYKQLDIQGFDNVKAEIKEYLAGIKDYKCNLYKFTPKIIDMVRQNFAFTIEKWGYDVPKTSQTHS